MSLPNSFHCAVRGVNIFRYASSSDITGQRQLRRANAAAGAFVRLKHGHRLAGLSDNNCRGESVRTRADNHGVIGDGLSHSTEPCLSHEDNARSEHTTWIYSPAQKCIS